jgi:hypothetical protein
MGCFDVQALFLSFDVPEDVKDMKDIRHGMQQCYYVSPKKFENSIHDLPDSIENEHVSIMSFAG